MSDRITYRAATQHDIEAIAALHADSWRRNYRGAYSDAFLDEGVLEDRLGVWRRRLTPPTDPGRHGVVAERDGAMVGFAYTIFDDDPEWGSLLDNLHVAHELRGTGVGTELMARAAQAVVEHRPSSGLYLWVLKNNTAAQAFYDARGGTPSGSKESEAPGGGTIVGIRYAWPDPRVLLRH
jgi:ribosomal protein S18 acetylase RimI-like enzyme